jgi:hypothetical protein
MARAGYTWPPVPPPVSRYFIRVLQGTYEDQGEEKASRGKEWGFVS